VALYPSALILHFERQEVRPELLALVFKFGNLLVRVQIFHDRESVVFWIKVSLEHSRIHPDFFFFNCLGNLAFDYVILAVSVSAEWLLLLRRWPPVNVRMHG
jgi:hypothetical protein